MPVLKVWNSKRDKKKLVIVSEFSIAILKEKGIQNKNFQTQ